MNKIISTAVFLIFSLPCFASADDFLGAPVPPGGIIVDKTDDRLEMTAEMGHDEALAFYRDALKSQPDINYRDWKEATYIEDDGRQAWHSITISKLGTEKTSITIARDSWSWIIGTLFLRFIGVFVVLCVLYLGMSVSGEIILRSLSREKA